MDLVVLLPVWLIGIVVVAVTVAIRRPSAQEHVAPRPVKPVWPFILMTVLSLPVLIAFSLLLSLIGVWQTWTFLFGMGLSLAMLIGGVTMVIVLTSSNSKAQPLSAATPRLATPLGYTNEGHPIYPVVGYTSDGSPVTADKALGYQQRNERTNSNAIVALVLGLVFPLLAIPFGHVARGQIRQTGEQGAGMALAGLILGYLGLVWIAIAIILIIAAANGAI